MNSTMQDVELSVSDLLTHGAQVHPDSTVTHYHGADATVRTFASVADEAARLAGVLGGLGVGPGDVVATLCWNTPAHLAAYLGVPSSGAVLHTLNLRLSDEQLVHIITHAGERVVIVDEDLVPQLARLLPACPEVHDVVVVGERGGPSRPGSLEALRATRSGLTVHDHGALLAAATPVTDWPRLPERSAAILCYTTGTTGAPKGVAYSHRSIYLHTLMISSGSAYAFHDGDRVLPVVPMFHANAWGWPHAAWANGASLIMTDRYLQAEHLSRIMTLLRPTAAAAVPTLWNSLDRYGVEHGERYESLRLAVSGGSALSAALSARFTQHHGVTLLQGWGMTETSPLVSFSRPPAGLAAGDATSHATRTGRLMPGVRARIVDAEGIPLPWDGVSAGEVELRGPTITGAYLGDPEGAADRFRDGWLRTGDLGVIHEGGWVDLKDRIKDGIKSGGEWISTVELENLLADHPAVADVAVVGVPDDRWEERPLVCVVLNAGSAAGPDELRAHLDGRVARWWLPERWAFLPEIPRTSVGKHDKEALRRRHAAEAIPVEAVGCAARG